MIRPLVLPLIFATMIFTGCGDNQKENNNQNNSITINKIEKKITKKQTNLGCEDKEHNSSKECSQQEDSSAQFILNILAKKTDINKKEDLQNFMKSINDKKFENEDEKKLGTPPNNNIASIKKGLLNLIESEDSKKRPKEIKKQLETLMADMESSPKNISNIQKNIIKLVEEEEKKDTPSAKKFTKAIINDVIKNKIDIIEENENFYIIKVKRGDNLGLLAKRYYNDKSKYKIIYEANKDKINSNYEIYPGIKLLIPKI